MNDLPTPQCIADTSAESASDVTSAAIPQAASGATMNAHAVRAARRIGCYLRVSSADQSHESQKADVLAWLEHAGIDPALCQWFSDTISGKEADRPGLSLLCRAVASGNVTTVVVQRLDRLSRSAVDGLALLAEWAGDDVRIVAVKQQIDFCGPVGKLIATVLLGVAEMELELRRERQAAGIAIAKAAGKFKGRKRGTFKGDWRRAQELRSHGATMREICDVLHVTPMTARKYVRWRG